MIKHLTLTDRFKTIPYLAGTALWAHVGQVGLSFSTEKPNIIVGPNGAGKSALLTLLAMQTLTYLTGESSLDDGYTRSHEADAMWDKETWRTEPVYLPGAEFVTDNAPSLYYRPGHIPGNDDSVTAAMMCGYFEPARAYGRDTNNRSSGQGCAARLRRVQDALAAPDWKPAYARTNWGGGTAAVDLYRERGYVGPWDWRAEVLKRRYREVSPTAVPLILMDEPEQSLDALAEMQLWDSIRHADCATRQLIIATHSIHPFLHPEDFHFIEATPGYLETVMATIRRAGLCPTAGDVGLESGRHVEISKAEPAPNEDQTPSKQVSRSKRSKSAC